MQQCSLTAYGLRSLASQDRAYCSALKKLKPSDHQVSDGVCLDVKDWLMLTSDISVPDDDTEELVERNMDAIPKTVNDIFVNRNYVGPASEVRTGPDSNSLTNPARKNMLSESNALCDYKKLRQTNVSEIQQIPVEPAAPQAILQLKPPAICYSKNALDFSQEQTDASTYLNDFKNPTYNGHIKTRRLNRNVREQKRNYSLISKIDELNYLLMKSGIVVKPHKKNILSAATELIKSLQQQHNTVVAERDCCWNILQQIERQSIENSANSTVLDYQLIFKNSTTPLAVSNVGGNFVDCNERMSSVTGYPSDILLTLTIFDLVSDAYLQLSFVLFNLLLSDEGVNCHRGISTIRMPCKSYSGTICGILNIALVRDDSRQPKFFSVSVTPE